MQNRVIIHSVSPELEGGQYFIKRIQGDTVQVKATVFGDGHDVVRAAVCYRKQGAKKWEQSLMTELGGDIWAADFQVGELGFYDYKIEGWVDQLMNWYRGFKKKFEAGQQMEVELKIGADFLKTTAKQYKGEAKKQINAYAKLLDGKDYQAGVAAVLSENFGRMVSVCPMKQYVTTYDKKLRVRVGRKKELFSAWYELFPRSTAKEVGEHGSFKTAKELIPRVAEMGFDVLYFPPVHPIGKINRKGKNNAVTAQEGEPGSPWAIGSDEGGHKALHPELGTLEEFKDLIEEAAKFGLEVAMDIAFQAAPDHPWIKEHPEWFIWRPDGTIMYAENPPKKYQDIVPINFESTDWKNLWEELKSVFTYWAEQGVRVFRVDNPHTKSFRFWEWCIAEVQKEYPDTIFLSESFTRPNVMNELAKLGYTQSYTYFTWRTNKQEMEQYLTDLSKTEMREYFRPNFWPNTPDILAYEMMHANENQFVKRFLLAATLSSNYGMYGPVYEFLDNTPMNNGKEEYLNSEKYEIKVHDWNARNRMTDIITRVNRIRRENPALQDTYNIHFTRTDNDQIMSYIKMTPDRKNVIWCVVNFDPNHTQAARVELPRELLRVPHGMPLRVHDLLRNETYFWSNDWNYVELNPYHYPIHILRLV